MQVIGHRGAAAVAPENTWAGFDVALALGVDAIETDVQATSDGRLVLFHDKTLDRTTNGSGVLRETPWSMVRDLDAGSWFGEQYCSARVPLLDETLNHYGRRTQWAIEVKQEGIELRALSSVRERDLLSRVTFTSFHYQAAKNIKEACPEARVGWLAREASDQNARRALDAGLDQFCPPAEGLTPEGVAAWQAQGIEVRAWGVRTVALMRVAVSAGVDGMTVDFPHILLQTLGRYRGR